MGVDFVAANTATNCLLVAVSYVTAMVREAMVDAFVSKVSDFSLVIQILACELGFVFEFF